MSTTQPAATALPETNGETSERAPGEGQSGNRQKLKAIILGPVVKQDLTTGQTKELPPDDMISTLVADGKAIAPPFDKLVLAMLPEQSTSLGPLIEAMTQNIDGFGYRLVCRVRVDDPECPDELKAEVTKEKAKLVNFFNNACMDMSFTEMRKRSRTDIESTGEAYWEVIRVPATGQVVGLNHIPSYQMTLGVQDKTFTTFKRPIPVITDDGGIVLEQATYHKRFRRYVQCRINTFGRNYNIARGHYQVRWFKEFGDPRVIDNKTGDPVPKDKLASFPEEQKASEMIHHRIYSPRTPYGLPRYIGNLITLFGDRAADEVNYVTLRNNNVPSMVVLVSNGQLTEASIQRISDFVETQIHGSDNFSRFLLLEAEGQFEGTETHNIKVDIKPLTSEQMRDQLFQEYSKNNRDKTRESFRLPPIFVGRSEDYTRATAEASRRLADEQVFAPERDEFDSVMNKTLLPTMGVRYHTFKSNGPNVTDDEDLINILSTAERTGGMTPALARQIISDIFGKDEAMLPPLSDTVDPDIPFSLQLAEAVKNTTPGAGVPTQSHLAVKSSSDLLKELLNMRHALEIELVRRGE